MAYNDIQQNPVQSSWIKELIKSDEDVLIRLKSGHQMIARRIPQNIYEQWVSAKSIGQYFHQNIKTGYQIDTV